MEWLDRMRNALDYLEMSLDRELDMNIAARIACSSLFHFQRMFHMISGITLAEYVRKRRLTLAAQELASTNIRVLDAALKYGYDTPESFCKAFRKLHGITPSAARNQGAVLKAYPRLSFQIMIKGDQDMNYRIMDKGAFRVVGKDIRVSTKDGENSRRIPQFWTECCQDGTSDKLCSLNSENFLGICMEFNPEDEKLTYMVAVENGDARVPEGFVKKEIPAATWAIFESIGPMPSAIQKVWERIFSEWFPATGYEHAGGPELEVYPPGDNQDPNYRCEVWIPIVKK